MKIIVYRQELFSPDQQERFVLAVTNELMTLLKESAGFFKVHFMADLALIGDSKVLVIFFDRGPNENSKVIEVVREQGQNILGISDVVSIIWKKECSWRAGVPWKK